MWFESTAAHQLLLIQSSEMNQMLIINDAPKPDIDGEAGLRLFGAKPVLVSVVVAGGPALDPNTRCWLNR